MGRRNRWMGFAEMAIGLLADCFIRFAECFIRFADMAFGLLADCFIRFADMAFGNPSKW
jgi:hypothetical protein